VDAFFLDRRVVLNPAEKRRVIDGNAALAHHLFEVAVADHVFAIPADTDKNDAGRETAAFEIGQGSAKGCKFYPLPPMNATVVAASVWLTIAKFD
jgi:hypothetical protein